MKKFYIIFVTLFWFIMMGLLFDKEVIPSLVITNPAGYKLVVDRDSPIRESWMGIYFKDTRIGFSNTIISQEVDSGIPGFRISEMTVFRLNILGEDRIIRMKGSSFLTEDYSIRNFNYSFQSAGHKISVSGEAQGPVLKLNIDTGRERIKKEITAKDNAIISNSISPILLFKKLDKNKVLNFEVFDPITMSANKVSVKGLGDEIIECGNARCRVNIFETDLYGIKTRTWIKDNGEIIKEESGLGFSMVRENARDAIKIADLGIDSPRDLLSEFSIPSDIKIPNPRDVFYLKIQKSGLLAEIFKDKPLEREEILNIPIEKIPDELFIQSKDARIIGLAEQITAGERDSLAASRKILTWVYNNIRKTPTLSIPSSLDVLATREGDCNEHTVLFTALCRSIGIPVKMIAGLVYLENAFYYHAWAKVYVGRWINMDPTLGQEIADATHIPLIEGGIKEQIELLRIIPELKIEVIEYK